MNAESKTAGASGRNWVATTDLGRPTRVGTTAWVVPVSGRPAPTPNNATMEIAAGAEKPASAAKTAARIPTEWMPSCGTVVRRSERAGACRGIGPVLRAVFAGALLSCGAWGQPAGFNYDESKVPSYELPEILRRADGGIVDAAAGWPARRAEILTLFEEQVYGISPPAPARLQFTVLEEDGAALGGLARRKQVRVDFGGGDGSSMEILLYTPAGTEGRVAVFVGLNFRGNHTVHADPGIRMPARWILEHDGTVTRKRDAAETRGRSASRWQVEHLLKRGYGLATVYCGDLDPDFDDGFENGVHALAPPVSPADWGSISAWAWGLSRALDYLETDPHADGSRVAVMGHSRLGKTALWAGARDTRFAMVISNNSGCGGAALSRRRFGETVARINTRFPHWFADNFSQYNGEEDRLPVDQHMLLALVAPRPLYVASAEDDVWADPKGEFLSAMHAGRAYELLGEPGLGVSEQPPVNQPVMRTVGYHIRTGKHDVTAYDWDRYLDFGDMHLKRD